MDRVPVVAVVLSRGSDEAQETLDSLTAQGHPALRSAALDDIDDVTEGFLLFVHDDVALEPGALSAMVATAEEHDAGIVGPKLVAWDDARRLLQFGLTVDRTGSVLPLVERGDLDQGQYDEIGEVFAVPGACMLVRADVFRSIGGFDMALGPLVDDVGLCWRARLAGARVAVAPGARARHRETQARRLSSGARRRLLARQRLRAALTCYSGVHTARVLPQVVATGMAETVGALATARPTDAAAVATAWAWNLRHCRSLWATRRQVRRFRQVPDVEIRRYQASGLVRPRLAARRLARDSAAPPTVAGPSVGTGDGTAARATGTGVGAGVGTAARAPGTGVGAGVGTAARATGTGVGAGVGTAARATGTGVGAEVGTAAQATGTGVGTGVGTAARAPGTGVETGVGTAAQATGTGVGAGVGTATRAPWTTGDAVVGLLLAAVFLLGSRHLLTRGVPAVGELLPFGLPGVGGLVRTALTVGLVPVGIVGALVAMRPTGSRHAALAAAVAYAAVPIPYEALASGRWEPLALYAVAPWWLHELAWLGGLPSGWRSVDRLRRVVVLGMATALVAAAVPAAPLVLVGKALALALGGLAAVRPKGGLRLVGTAVAAAAVAVVLQAPWSLDVRGWRSGGLAAAGTQLDPVDVLDLGGVAGFDARPWLWALPIVALVPLLCGRADRLAGAIKLWTLALCAWAVAFAAARAGVEPPLPDIATLLVPAAAAIAGAVGLAAATVEHDIALPRSERVRRRDRRRWRAPTHARRLGARNLTAAVVGTGLALGAVPVLVGTLDGAWGMPAGQFSQLLTFVDDDVAASGAQVLWLADPDLAPLRHDRIILQRAGQPRTEAAVAATPGLPRLGSRWRPVPRGMLGGARLAIEAAVADETTRVGRRLAGLGVEYVVVPRGLAPTVSGVAPAASAAGRSLEATLDSQLDLERVDVDPAVAIYRNLAFRRDLVGQQPQDRWATSWPWRIRLGLAAWVLAAAALVVIHRIDRIRREAVAS